VAGLLTRKFTRPLQRLAANLDAYQEDEAYEELTPLVNMIKDQHQDIIKAARIRQDFTANVTHELKTPLTSISGYAELLETGMASEKEVQRFAQGIHKSANRLLSLINDIIKLSELDSAEQEFVTEQVDLYELAQTCVEMLQPNAEKHQVTLLFEMGEMNKSHVVKGNKQMLEELLFNLCDNAIRYNNPGGNVWVQVTVREEQILLKVKDNGIGIPPEHQDRIFEKRRPRDSLRK
jgi:two-component system phosphate regulon sensor histidine kinase PhoR